MAFNLSQWKQEVNKRLWGWKERMQHAGVNSIYYFLSAVSLIPILEAARAGNWSALVTLGGVIGTNLLANQLQHLKELGDEATTAKSLENAVEETPELRDEINAILEQLSVIPTAESVLDQREKDWFTRAIREELTQYGNTDIQIAKIIGKGIIAQDSSSVKIKKKGTWIEEGAKDNILITERNNHIYYILNQFLKQSETIFDKRKLHYQIVDYLNWVRNRYGSIELRGIKREGHQVIQIDLEKVYVPLLGGSYEKKKEISFDQVLGEGNRLIITGGPGSGKTTVLQHIASTLANAILRGDDQLAFRKLGLDLDRIYEEDKRGIEDLKVSLRNLTDLQKSMLSEIDLNIFRLFEDGIDLKLTLKEVRQDYKKLGGKEKSLLKELKLNTTVLEVEKKLPLPIYVPLNAYADYLRSQKNISKARQKTLASFISFYLIEKQSSFNLPTDFFELLILDGQTVILLLDGLDEVANEQERVLVREAIETLIVGRGSMHAVVTCRTIAYKERTALPSNLFRELKVKPLSNDQIAALVSQAYNSLFPSDQIIAQQKANDLLHSIQKLESERRIRSGMEIEPLITTPLLIRLLLVVHYSDRHLPEQRAELYMKATDAMLLPEYNPDEAVSERIGQMVGGSLQIHRELAQFVAFSMHERGNEQGREISESGIRRLIAAKPEYKDKIEDLIVLTRTRGTLLEERLGSYRFIHLSFQEFLAGRYLAEIVRSQSGVEGIANFLENGTVLESWWREPTLLLVGYLSIVSPDAAELLLKRLVGLDENASERNIEQNIQVAAAEIAGSALLELVSVRNEFKKQFVQKLRQIFEKSVPITQVEPIFRTALGDTLARLGDTRFREDAWYLPDEPLLGFVIVPEGEFLMGTNEKDFSAYDYEKPQHKLNLKDYYIARNLVTVAQFRSFVQDTGYSKHDKAALNDSFSRPVRFVTWYDAMIYCKWLNEKLMRWNDTPIALHSLLKKGWHIKLPSEAEWEKAARGIDGRIFPWGGEPDPRRANFQDTGIRTTSTVGCFASGASPYGVQDMSGNIWEWTSSIWGKYRDRPDYKYPYNHTDGRENPKGGKYLLRVVRGGSYEDELLNIRCNCRHRVSPKLWDSYTGFRVVLASSTESVQAQPK
ncbi:MAG: SUMF1/EgtB/PvdO family nonheme iron enzyme [Anaerolineales bacterium]|nr:SUMF1/EgtB/PvdO family nonheme iron enzyme [Anaerolineales bacterium]